LIYLPEARDSLIEVNVISNNAIVINNNKVFDLETKNQDLDLSIKLSENHVA
jgi:hypothetical protein